ncbi:hypothetical protein BLA29_010142, partial [Euroglyphus maynei]
MESTLRNSNNNPIPSSSGDPVAIVNDCATIELIMTNNNHRSSSSLNNKNRNFKFIEHKNHQQSCSDNDDDGNQECERIDDDDGGDIGNEMNLVCEKFVNDLKNKLSIVSKNNDIHDDDCDDGNIRTKEEIDIISDISDYSNNSMEKKSIEFDMMNETIVRIIGSVPIAQYEGSPKRYGPKPGYPK